MDEIRILILTIKYWLFQGDEWKFANEYAKFIVNGWKKPDKKEKK